MLRSSSDLLQQPGAVYANGETRFRVWAPDALKVEVVVEAPEPCTIALEDDGGGYFAGASSKIAPGALYRYRVDGEGPWPDPCSRFQPQGSHGPSMVVDAQSHRWRDHNWLGARMHGQVIYELHIGAFTLEGTFDAAIGKLDWLRDLGVTMLEVMPVAACPGRFNWGYDGVHLFAPSQNYGDYDGFKRFIDAAHAHGLAVILDVVYNHLGPDGNYLKCFAPHYFSKRHHTEWGEALNFDDKHANGAREFVIANVQHWIGEFHLDGLRLDATQSIFDASSVHIIQELVQAARQAAGPRDVVIVAENEPQAGTQLLPPQQGGYGLDGMWNDDFHHAARVALTGSRDGYYRDYSGRAQEFLSCIRHGFLYQGQWYEWQKKARGAMVRGLSPQSRIVFTQNHDQVGNTGLGDRIHAIACPARYRALTALMLLGPQTPLLFMGQEFGSTRRFTFFADHHEELARIVHNGRREFIAQFRAYADAKIQSGVLNPASVEAFDSSKLDWSEAERNTHAVAFHRDLLALRRSDPVISQHRSDILEGATLSECALVLRWFDDVHGDRLLLVNLGADWVDAPASEPLLAPRPDQQWRMAWSSEAPEYDGLGASTPVEAHGRGRWRLQGQSAVLLTSASQQEEKE